MPQREDQQRQHDRRIDGEVGKIARFAEVHASASPGIVSPHRSSSHTAKIKSTPLRGKRARSRHSAGSPDGFMPGAKPIYSIASNQVSWWRIANGRRGKARASEEAPRAELRLHDMEFEPSPLQPRATSVGFVRAVAFNSALRRLYAVARALEVGCGVLAGGPPPAPPSPAPPPPGL